MTSIIVVVTVKVNPFQPIIAPPHPLKTLENLMFHGGIAMQH